MAQCDLPPIGWHCNLQKGHEGPCPTWPDNVNGWREAARSAYWAFESLSEATTIAAQGQAMINLSNYMHDLISWLPEYDYEVEGLPYNEFPCPVCTSELGLDSQEAGWYVDKPHGGPEKWSCGHTVGK